MSILNRFGLSLMVNLLKVVASFFSVLIIARGLGPEQYGSMMFLLATFTAVRQLFDFGSSTAFFTFLSQRQRTLRFVGWYFAWLGFQFMLLFLAVALLIPNYWIELIWRGEQRELVILALLAAYMQSVAWNAMAQIGESMRLTHWVQGITLLVALFYFLLVTCAWWGGWLNIRTVLGLNIIQWLIAIVVITKRVQFPNLPTEIVTGKSVFLEFWQYCRPLILYCWLGFAYEFVDRWLLQSYAGSIQQAYFSVAFQFGSISAIVTSSILNIFWKEVAEAHHQKDNQSVAMLFRRVSRSLFFFSACIAGFLVPWSEDILRYTLGKDYVGGATTLIIMFFYPLHQSMGQIAGTMSYATYRTSVYVKIGMAFMVTSIIMSYFALANNDSILPGFGLGALGLASKMVLMQIIQVNVLIWYLSRSLEIKFDWIYQPVAAIISVGAGVLSYNVSANIVVNGHIFAQFLIAGIFYVMLIVLTLHVFPWLLGMSRSELFSILNRPILFFKPIIRR